MDFPSYTVLTWKGDKSIVLDGKNTKVVGGDMEVDLHILIIKRWDNNQKRRCNFYEEINILLDLSFAMV